MAKKSTEPFTKIEEQKLWENGVIRSIKCCFLVISHALGVHSDYPWANDITITHRIDEGASPPLNRYFSRISGPLRF